jgi:hypothetical protein
MAEGLTCDAENLTLFRTLFGFLNNFILLNRPLVI